MQTKLLPTLGLILPFFSGVVQANVEKTIFLAPAIATIPSEQPALDDLGLERLSPQSPVVRTRLNASFPTTAAPEGTESWFFLENLNPGQRYEVRVCWLATVSLCTRSFSELILMIFLFFPERTTDKTSNQHPLP
jgi:hypothetical protein